MTHILTLQCYILYHGLAADSHMHVTEFIYLNILKKIFADLVYACSVSSRGFYQCESHIISRGACPPGGESIKHIFKINGFKNC